MQRRVKMVRQPHTFAAKLSSLPYVDDFGFTGCYQHCNNDVDEIKQSMVFLSRKRPDKICCILTPPTSHDKPEPAQPTATRERLPTIVRAAYSIRSANDCRKQEEVIDVNVGSAIWARAETWENGGGRCQAWTTPSEEVRESGSTR